MSKHKDTFEEPEPFTDPVYMPDMIQDEDIKVLLWLLLDRLKLDLVRTNRTKHGNTELQLRPREDEGSDV